MVRRDKKLAGSSLLVVLLATAFLVALVGSLTSLLGAAQKQSSHVLNRLVSQTIAEGGAQTALAALRAGSNPNGVTYVESADQTVLGTVEISVINQVITVKGSVPSASTPGKTCRMVRLSVDATNAIVPHSYQELACP